MTVAGAGPEQETGNGQPETGNRKWHAHHGPRPRAVSLARAAIHYVAGSAGEEGSIFWTGSIPAPCGVELVSVGIQLMPERGVFSNGIVTGTYVLQGEELDIDTCATCVSLVVDTGAPPPDCYFATGGTLVLSSVQGRMIGHLDAASFVQVECSTWKSPGSCTTSIEYLSFDEQIIPII